MDVPVNARRWSATARLADLPSPPTRAQLDKLTGALAMDRLTYDPARQELRLEWSFALRGTLRDAVADAEKTARKLMEHAHIRGRLVGARADEWEAQAPHVVHLDLMGEAEAAALLAISQEALREQVRAGGGPHPVAVLSSGPVFMGDQVRRIASGFR